MMFNGAPRSGKNTLAGMVREVVESKTDLIVFSVQLSKPMRLMAFAMDGLAYNEETYERVKDEPMRSLPGITMRKFMIKLSEDFVKPNFGPDSWVRAACASLGTAAHVPALALVSDLGFQFEASYIESLFGVENTCVVQTIRNGKNFDNDSRQYCRSANRTHVIDNNSNLDDLKVEAIRLYGHMVNQMGWKL
jgi:hypothetical protein